MSAAVTAGLPSALESRHVRDGEESHPSRSADRREVTSIGKLADAGLRETRSPCHRADRQVGVTRCCSHEPTCNAPVGNMSSTRSVDPSRLRDKAEIRRLVIAAQKSLKQSTNVSVALAIGMSGEALGQALSRGSLAGEHVEALQEVIRTGKPALAAFRSDELAAAQKALRDLYASLDARNRAELAAAFFAWLERERRRLRTGKIHAIEGNRR